MAVGTGQAITNARAGQGDVLITHAPALEAQFVADGFSLEPAGRTIMWNDFVIVGPPGDPAGVAAAARHDAAAAFEAIAAAGAAGRATFVSRGDNSGTNTKEKDIWKLTSVARNGRGEPTSDGTANPSWYTKAGLGMADTLRLTQQCPARRLLHDHRPRHAAAADRQRRDHGAADRDGRAGRGRARRLVADGQPVPRLCAQPGQGPARQDGGRARVPGLPHLARLPGPARQLPDAAQPGFFPAAFPVVSLARRAPRSLSARRTLVLRGTIASAVPGAPPLDGARVRLSRFTSPLTARTLGSAVTDARGAFRIRWRPDRSGRLFLTTPRFRDLSPLRRALGQRAGPRRGPAARSRACARAGGPARSGVAGDRTPARAAGGARAAGRGRPLPGGPAAATAEWRQPLQARRRARPGPLGRSGALRRPRHRGGGTIRQAVRRGRLIAALAALVAAALATPAAHAAGVVVRLPDRETRIDEATLRDSVDVPAGTYTLRAKGGAGDAIAHPPAVSLPRLLELAGVAPDALSFVSIRRPNGTLRVLRAPDLARPAPFPEGPPLVWLDADSVRFLRPVRDDADVNGADNIATAGEDLAVRVHQGPLLEVALRVAPRRPRARRARASKRASPARRPAPR